MRPPRDRALPRWLARLNRPEYFLNPRSALRRLRGGGSSWEGPGTIVARLPWSQEITVFRDEIGRMIFLTGIFDLTVTETIHRLTESGGLAVDVGANVGYLTSLMAVRAGPNGSVFAFEPHPQVSSLLIQNAHRWSADPKLAPIQPRGVALSSRPGRGHLQMVDRTEGHLGLSSLEVDNASAPSQAIEVELATIDDLFPTRPISLLKLDVEGHEASVLNGAETILAEKRIRDLVFEEHAIYPAPSMTLLERHGMTLFTLKQTPFGPRVHPIEEGPAAPEWPGPNYLATLEPERALDLLRPRGWRSLRGTTRFTFA